MKLLDDAEEVEHGQHDGDQEVETDQGADDTEDDAQKRNLSQQADEQTDDGVGHDEDDQVDDEGGQFLGLEGTGKILFESIHGGFLLIFCLRLGIAHLYFSIIRARVKQRPYCCLKSGKCYEILNFTAKAFPRGEKI